ncbi:uncharacterized protein zgc:194930 [Pungitius pungitius]|uniref:uncharacterized protein zgc:194930 n=1 Tax=Pungitius pungitius TaxID=134920 RepID=UPI002E0DDCEA
MGGQCCRVMKSYVYEPSEAVDEGKSDSAESSLYQPHHLPGGAGLGSGGGLGKQKEGFSNLGYSRSNNSTLKLEVDNNHVNQRLHAARPPASEPDRQGSAPPADAAGVYIIQPAGPGPRWATRDNGPSPVPVYPETRERDRRGGRPTADGSLSADEADEGVGGTPEYLCDTGDEGSVLSVEVHTSTTSLSSADTRDELRPPKAPDASTVESGISVMKSEDEQEDEELRSVTDSMVAEALAALEAATAGEDSE